MIAELKERIVRPFSLVRDQWTALDLPGRAARARNTVTNATATARNAVVSAWRTVAGADYFALLEKAVTHLRTPFDHFQQTLTEANYNAAPRSLWSMIQGHKRETPETTPLVVGEGMIGTSKKVGNRYLWAAVFAALSTKTLLAAAVVLATAGTAIVGLEYWRARKDRLDVITEVNFAGQKVQGSRADLCRLHMAQVRIMNLGSTFQRASLESTTDTIARLMESVAEEKKRVKVLEPGPFGAMSCTYDFSRPEISLVNKWERGTQASAPDAPSAVNFPKAGSFRNLRESWKNKRDREEEILDRLVALQKSLPPDLKRKFRREIVRAS